MEMTSERQNQKYGYKVGAEKEKKKHVFDRKVPFPVRVLHKILKSVYFSSFSHVPNGSAVAKVFLSER